MEVFKNYRDHVPIRPGKVGKETLFESSRLLLGLNALEPRVEQSVHTHAEQDKFYHVLEGEGEFTVGAEVRSAGPGEVVWAPAGVEHGVRNGGERRLVLLVGMVPPP